MCLVASISRFKFTRVRGTLHRYNAKSYTQESNFLLTREDYQSRDENRIVNEVVG